MPKVLLIQPLDLKNPGLGTEDLSAKVVPISLMSLAAFLRENGYKVKIIDSRVSKEGGWGTLDKELMDTDCVGISAMTVHVKHGLRISEYIKRKKDIPVVWGGIHPTLFPKQTCADPSVDYVVFGEGEYAFLELLNHLFKKKFSLGKIKGIVYKEGDEVRINGKGEPIDINLLPTPAYDLVDIEKYVDRMIRNTPARILDITTSRGCPYRCAFCTNSILEAQRWRAIQTEKILDLVETLSHKYKIDGIHIVDDFFFGDKARVEKFARGIIKMGLRIKWEANIRVDCLRDGFIDDSLMGLLKKSGCHALYMGAESGSDEVLKIIKKDITVKQIEYAVKQCHKHDITPFCFFMIGIPGETRSDMEKTFDLMRKLIKICPDVQIYGPGVFRPYPGSELYDLCKKNGGFYEPKSLREWADSSLDASYINLKKLDWFKEKDFIKKKRVYFHWEYSSTNPYAKKTAFSRILGKVSRFRFEHDFWLFQFEPVLVPLLIRLKGNISRIFRH